MTRRPRLVMTLLVRDEADIVAENVAWHLSQGIDHVIAMDNASTDGTDAALRPFAEDGRLTLLYEPSTAYRQGEWATRMALMAREEQSADWIFCNDADEFWRAPTGDLRDGLPDDPALLVCRRHNMISSREMLETAHWAEVLTYRADPAPELPSFRKSDRSLPDPELQAPFFYHALPHKALFPAIGLRRVARGGHHAEFDGEPPPRRDCGIEILHFPVRSRAEFSRSVHQIGRAVRADPDLAMRTSWKYRRWLAMTEEAGTIWPAFRETLPDRARLERDIAERRVQCDKTFAAALRVLTVPEPKPASDGADKSHGGTDMGDLILVVDALGVFSSPVATLLAARGAQVPIESQKPGSGSGSGSISDIHAAILTERSPGSPGIGPIQTGWIDTPVAASYRALLFDALISDYAGLDFAVIDSPETWSLLPLWQRLARDRELGIGCIIAVCDPRATARELERAHGIPRALGVLVWLRRMLEAERDSRTMTRVVLPAGIARTDPKAALSLVERIIAPDWPPVRSETLPDASYPTQEAEESSLMAARDVPDAAKETYEALQALAAGAKQDEMAPVFDKLRSLLDDTDDLMRWTIAKTTR